MGATTMIGMAVALVGATVAVAHSDQVEPPGVTGCAMELSRDDREPQATLPPTATFRPLPQLVVFSLRRPTQATRAELRAITLGGRRADAWEEGTYTCTEPGASNRLSFAVRPGAVGPTIRRHDFTRLRLRFSMVNAGGRRTVLQRTITVLRDPRSPRGRTPKLTTEPLLVHTSRGAVLHLSTDRPVRASVRIAGRRATTRITGTRTGARGRRAGTVFDAFVTTNQLRPRRHYPVTFRLTSRMGATTLRQERLVLRRSFPAP